MQNVSSHLGFAPKNNDMTVAEYETAYDQFTPVRKLQMDEKLPIPCEHCKATGLFKGSDCRECGGKGYRLNVNRRTLQARTEMLRPPIRAPLLRQSPQD